MLSGKKFPEVVSKAIDFFTLRFRMQLVKVCPKSMLSYAVSKYDCNHIKLFKGRILLVIVLFEGGNCVLRVASFFALVSTVPS